MLEHTMTYQGYEVYDHGEYHETQEDPDHYGDQHHSPHGEAYGGEKDQIRKSKHITVQNFQMNNSMALLLAVLFSNKNSLFNRIL